MVITRDYYLICFLLASLLIIELHCQAFMYKMKLWIADQIQLTWILFMSSTFHVNDITLLAFSPDLEISKIK